MNGQHSTDKQSAPGGWHMPWDRSVTLIFGLALAGALAWTRLAPALAQYGPGAR